MSDSDDRTASMESPTSGDRGFPRVPNFRIRSRVAEGGFGEVFVAEQVHPVRREVALKVIKPGMDSRAVVARFEAERQALAMMDHPCVAKVFEAGMTERERPYFAMEFVRGESITTFCDRHGLSIRARIRLLIRVAEAVQHAHQKGIIHRDIKPSNILVRYDGGEPTPKVIDFGVAKALTQRLSDTTIYTEQGQLIGTPEYMSPEQAEMSATGIDTRTDVYALGVLLYELLTGALPFDSGDLRSGSYVDVQRILREMEPTRPSSKVSGIVRSDPDAAVRVAKARGTMVRTLHRTITGDLDWIVLKCLEKERSRRYETSNGLAADLRRYLADEPVVARPPSTAYRARKFVRRNRVGVVAAAIVGIALLVGLAAATAGWVHAQREAERAKRAEERSELLRRLVRGGKVSLAVLPLRNTGSEELDYFADGVTEALIESLSKIHALQLVSDESVMQYRGVDIPTSEIARTLNVNGVVTGSAERSGDWVRLSIRLIHALTEAGLWEEHYEGRVEHLRELQAAAARDVAEAMGLELAAADEARLARAVHPINKEAYEAYMKGRFALRRAASRDQVALARGFFDEAIAIDPGFVQAHIGLAEAHLARSNLYEAPLDVLPAAKRAARQALALDDSAAEAHVALARTLFEFDWDWEGAKREIKIALDLNPNLAPAHVAYGELLVAQGDVVEGLAAIDHALSLDPLVFLSFPGHFYFVPFNAGDFERSVEYCDMGIAIQPDHWQAWAWKGQSLAMSGEYERALEALETARSIDDNPLIYVFLANLYANMGRMDLCYEMVAILEEQQEERYVCPYELATRRPTTAGWRPRSP